MLGYFFFPGCRAVFEMHEIPLTTLTRIAERRGLFLIQIHGNRSCPLFRGLLMLATFSTAVLCTHDPALLSLRLLFSRSTLKTSDSPYQEDLPLPPTLTPSPPPLFKYNPPIPCHTGLAQGLPPPKVPESEATSHVQAFQWGHDSEFRGRFPETDDNVIPPKNS